MSCRRTATIWNVIVIFRQRLLVVAAVVVEITVVIIIVAVVMLYIGTSLQLCRCCVPETKQKH